MTGFIKLKIGVGLAIKLDACWVWNCNAVFIKGFFDGLIKVKHDIPIMLRLTPGAALNIDRAFI